MRYILVEWPESQYFMGQENCYYCNSKEDEQLDQALFVPEDIYKKHLLELENTEEENTQPQDSPDYWTRLEHTYAGMAMQGLMSYVEQITPKKGRSFCDEIVDISFNVAHALVEKLKESK